MKVIITEEQLEYIASQELLNEGVDEGVLWNLARGAVKGVGKLARGASKGAGKLMKRKGGAIGKAGNWLLQKRPRKGAMANVKGIPFIFDGKVWKSLKGGKVIDPNKLANINGALNSQVKMLSNSDRIGNAAEALTAGAMVSAGVHGARKLVKRGKKSIGGYNNYANQIDAANPNAPENTDYTNSSDALQSMGFGGTGESPLTPRNSESMWGKLYDKYGKNQ